MSGFDSIVDQEQPVRIIKSFLKNGAVPHALMFRGIEGVGKKDAAVAFAMACNCRGPHGRPSPEGDSGVPENRHRPPVCEPCGQCTSCRKILSGNHPDILHIKPIRSTIKIDQIRALRHTLALKPLEARWRVVILEQAETMNVSAGNALLKILEEPPQRTALILVVNRSSALLPTIVSRCETIRFNPISENRLATVLVEENGLEATHAAVLASMAQGSRLKAQAMARSDRHPSWFTRRNWLIRASGLANMDPGKKITVGTCLALAQRLSQNKEQLEEDLDILTSFIRDVLVIRHAPERIIHKDIAETVTQASKTRTVASLLSTMEALQDVERSLTTSANVRLNMETVCLGLAAT